MPQLLATLAEKKGSIGRKIGSVKGSIESLKGPEFIEFEEPSAYMEKLEIIRRNLEERIRGDAWSRVTSVSPEDDRYYFFKKTSSWIPENTPEDELHRLHMELYQSFPILSSHTSAKAVGTIIKELPAVGVTCNMYPGGMRYYCNYDKELDCYVDIAFDQWSEKPGQYPEIAFIRNRKFPVFQNDDKLTEKLRQWDGRTVEPRTGRTIFDLQPIIRDIKAEINAS